MGTHEPQAAIGVEGGSVPELRAQGNDFDPMIIPLLSDGAGLKVMETRWQG